MSRPLELAEALGRVGPPDDAPCDAADQKREHEKHTELELPPCEALIVDALCRQGATDYEEQHQKGPIHEAEHREQHATDAVEVLCCLVETQEEVSAQSSTRAALSNPLHERRWQVGLSLSRHCRHDGPVIEVEEQRCQPTWPAPEQCRPSGRGGHHEDDIACEECKQQERAAGTPPQAKRLCQDKPGHADYGEGHCQRPGVDGDGRQHSKEGETRGRPHGLPERTGQAHTLASLNGSLDISAAAVHNDRFSHPICVRSEDPEGILPEEEGNEQSAGGTR
mmetsp:Transcript_30843/g.65590  ORF Transcript_30843/g.65590 Transcript_30843/m.65590 type:complete len:280 (-) Transcript_30843:415-1254(-)